jgi:hypothetical protein
VVGSVCLGASAAIAIKVSQSDRWTVAITLATTLMFQAKCLPSAAAMAAFRMSFSVHMRRKPPWYSGAFCERIALADCRTRRLGRGTPEAAIIP